MRWRRKPCDHGLLLAELEKLRVENAQLRVQLVTAQLLGWMHSAIVARHREQPSKARHRRVVCDAPTELLRRQR